MKQLWSIRTQNKAWMTFIVMMGIVVITVPIVSIYYAQDTIKEGKRNIYVLKNDRNLVRAVSTDLNNSYDILTKGQVEDINKLIFQQIPDPKNINERLTKARRIGDKSVADLIDALKTNRYFNNIIDKSYYTLLQTDKIEIDYSYEPHAFIYYGKIRIIRNQQTYFREIVTQGKIEFTGIKTIDDNRGYLIKDFKTIKFQTVDR